MNKKELIKKIAEANKNTITATEAFYKTFEHVLIAAITSHEKVILAPTIGRFVLKSRKAYIGSNPKTGKKIKIPASTRIIFKVAGSLKKEVKSLVLEE
ncbi:MAG: DNA-binding protein HU-beta [Candidatus Phytoplasma citri]|nr:MAG: DNA-binding protein HU-beta [Candidatus Phytoplasma aurantifolia]